MGDDAHPPWNNASSILTKRLIECLSPRVKCSLASITDPNDTTNSLGTERILVPGVAGRQSMNAVRLAEAVGNTDAEIIHLVGTNALVFSPIYKLGGGVGRIVRHVFTTYDRKDQILAPARWLTNRLFIDAYAFTMPWMGEWAKGRFGVRRIVIRPPINCDFYSPVNISLSEFIPSSGSSKTILYMGPLLSSRFPASTCLRALKMLVDQSVDARLVVLASPGRTSTEMAAAVKELGERMGLANRLVVKRVDLTEHQRVQAYNSADIVVFPFVGPVPERLADPPFGVLEAMSCGRVVLATNVLSVGEIVRDGETGILVPRASVTDLHKGFQRALGLKNSDEIATRAREAIMANFDYPRVCQEALAAYDSLSNA